MNNSILTDNLLCDALKIYQSDWFENTIFDKSEFETSQKFEKKMEKIIKSRSSFYHKVTLTGLRRVACAIVAIIILFCCSLTVGAVRNAIKDFFIKTFSTHDRITASENVSKKYPKTIEKIYELGYVPEGFELTDKIIDSTSTTYSYFNNDFSKVVFFQQLTKSSWAIGQDNENSTKSIEIINDIEVVIYTSTNSSDISLFWNNGEYFFSLSGTFNKNEAIEMCKSLKIKEK